MGSNALRKGTWSARRAAAAGAACALSACGSQAPECHSDRCAPTPIEVMTWWGNSGTSPGTSLREAAEAQPGVKVNLDPKPSTKDEMIASLQQVLAGKDLNDPVDAFLTHPGRDLLRWTPCGGDDRPELRALNASGTYADLSARFDPRVLPGLQCCSSGATDCAAPDLYAVPLALHQMNHIVSNKERFASCANVKVTDVTSLIALLSCLRGEDERRVISVPVNDFQSCQIGESTCWKNQDVAGQSLQYLLDSIFLLEAGASTYAAHWRGPCGERDSARAEELLRQVLQDLDQLRPYLNNCPPGRECAAPKNFDVARREVADGTAALLVAPDWTQLTDAGASETAELRPFPGTEGVFSFTIDSFALPLLPGISAEPGLRWLDTLLQPDVQNRFAKLNGAHAAMGDHAGLPPLLPSLEIQLRPTADPLQLRALLNDWAAADFKAPPPLLEEALNHDFRQARELGLLPPAAPDNAECGGP